jgi:two-component system, cell cycle sensor histidine kinase and response regulator CckA
MGQGRKPPKKTPNLRERAEASLRSKEPRFHELSLDEMSTLFHELQVHQIQLELQNEALRQAQTSLAETSKIYRDFYDFAPVGFLTLDETGLIREVNLTAARQLGVTRSHLVDKPFRFFIEVEDRDRFRLWLKQVFQEPGTQRGEIKLQRPDGGNFFARLDLVAVTDVSGERLCRTSIIDLSDLKQTERKLKESERLFASFMEHLPSVAVIRDLEGRYLFANAAWEQTFQKSREEWRSKTSDELWPPEVAAKFKEQDRLVIESGEAVQSLVTLRHADGLHHWSYYRFPIVDQDGQPVMIGVNAVDITESMATKARLEQVLDSSPAAIYTCEPRGDLTLTYMSENIKALVGWKAQDFLADSRFWLNHVHPEDRPQIIEQLEFPWREDHQSFEYRFLTQNGAYRWMHDEFWLMRDADGKPVEMAGAWMDITARKQAEEALKESESHYRLLVNQIPAVVFKGYADWSIDFFDQKIEGLTGYRKEEFDSRHLKWCDLILPEDLDKAQGIFLEALKTDKSYVREYRIRKKGGEIGWVQGRGQIFRDAAGQVDYVSGVFFDITERKAAETMIHQERQRFFSLLDMLPALVCLMAPDLTIAFANRQFREIFGDPEGRTCHELFHGNPTPCDDCTATEILETQKPLGSERTTPQGRTYHIYNYPFADIDGSPMVLTMGMDITERKALEAQLLQAQKMEAIGRLAGGVAHDFNNLLMAIMGYGELIRSSLVQDDPLYRYSEDILKASERAASLTQQLLAFSRQQVMQPQMLNLNRVVTDLEKMLRRLIGEHIDMEIVAGPDLGAVKADSGQMSQIIMNLAVNARDAMPKGGRLILSTANIDFAASHTCRFENIPPGGYVRLAVTDTGCGMEAETLDHIFEPFFTTKEMGKGTGLGLPMVYGIVKQNRGCVDVESRPGQGTTFKIYLPRLEAPVEAPGDGLTLAATLEGSETILVVEDEDELRTLLCRFFRLYGYNVMEARHGGEALLLCERHQGPIHLMVTDVVMPQMSGKELADRLAPLHPEMTVFFMSGYTDADLTGYGAPESSQHFIPKPFRPMDLVKKVRDLLDTSRGSTADTKLR